jgi:hypothetical protein
MIPASALVARAMAEPMAAEYFSQFELRWEAG